MNSISMLDKEPDLALQSILHSVFRRPETDEGIAIGFTSATPGSGVSYVSSRIAAQLSASSSGTAIRVSSADLCDGIWPGGSGHLNTYARAGEALSTNTWDDWRSKINKIRSRYRYSIIDCPSLSVSSDVLSLAPYLDGIVVVVAANETRKAQLANVERQIQMSNGKLLGLLLNKRKYVIPNWIYKLI